MKEYDEGNDRARVDSKLECLHFSALSTHHAGH